MKKLQFALLNSGKNNLFFPILQKSLLILLVFILTLSSANTMPKNEGVDDELNEDIIQVVTSFPSSRIDSVGIDKLIDACGLWSKDANGHPDPSYSGIPTTDCPTASITYEDDRVDGCGTETYELVRTWTITDSCDLNMTTYEQFITVGDILNPVCVAPNEYSAVVNEFECTVDIEVIPMNVIFECSSWDYSVSYMLINDPLAPMFSASGNSTDGFVIETVAASQDSVWIIYNVTDACGNSKKCFTEVVIDNSLNEGNSSIVGPSVTCLGNTESYSFLTDPSATYNWQLVSGGSIVGPSNTQTIQVDWTGPAAANYELSVEMTTSAGCVSTDTIDVLIGVDGGAVALTNNINFSLGASCALTITPAMVSAGPLPANGAFEVILMDDVGNVVPDATLTSEYIGWPIMVSLRNVCTGNAAMGTLHVFDKMGPTLTCTNKELFCYEASNDGGPDVFDNCGGEVTMNLIDSTYVTINCDPLHMAEITKTYIAYDEYGNASLPCTYSILVKRYPMDDIDAPSNYMIADNTALECGTFTLDNNGNPSVDVTGVPTLNGVSIFPLIDQACGVGIGYTDNIINASTCNTKIMRTWTIFESWCTLGKLVQFTQVIEIVDTTDPVISCISGMEVTTNGYSCYGDVLLPAMTATDNCTDDLTFDVVYPGGSLIGQNGGLVSLPMGNNDVSYVVTDACGQQDTCTFNVLVKDETPPVAVLYENVVVSLTDDGTAWFPVVNLNAGSFDDCAFMKIEAMRMDEGVPCDIVANTFEDNLHFCCTDANTEVMIVVRVTDVAGNHNDAMVSVQVQDKTTPIITCPADETVECGYVFDIEDFSAFGTATVTHACTDEYTSSISSNISACGTGYYTRTFTTMDGSASCTQTINVVSSNPFDYNSIDWPDDYFPEDACLDADLLPENLVYPYNYPSSNIEVCQLVGFSFKDKKYTVSNACYKIVRTWTATDECDDNALPLTYDQTIMVSNNVPPVITSSCDPVQAISSNCTEGSITLTATATDACTDDDNLYNSYQVDLNNDGTFEPAVIGIGSTMSFSGVYPLGTHKVAWLFEDRCGNVQTCTQEFSIINEMQPIAYCIDGLSVGLVAMDLIGDDGVLDTEMACVNASMFDGGSSHPCGYDVTVSFSSDVTDTVNCITCEDLGNYPIELWVTDENGTQSFCTTTLSVQDNNDDDICERNCDLLEHPTNFFEVNTCGDDLSPETINSMPVVPAESPCQDYDITYTDEIITTYSTDDCFFLIRSWTVTYNCGSDEVCEFEQTIIRNNYIAPEITCPSNIVVANLGECEVDVVVPSPIVLAYCNTGVVVTNDFNNGGDDASGSYPTGTTPVVYTVTDACENVAVCTVFVTVEDEIDPICNAMDATVALGDDGTLTITPDVVNDGSSDECGEIVNMTVSPNEFGCDDAGTTVEVTLTVFDDSGNSSSCTADVTIEDESLPIARCQPNGTVTFYLDANGEATIDPTDIDNGSSSVCGNDVTLSTDLTELDCDNIPSQSVFLTVTASNGTMNTCNSLVNVVDTISPICNTQNITVNTNQVFNVNMINNNSTDNCTPSNELNLVLDIMVFGCDDLGDQIVTLTVTDEYNNSSSCTAIVTVVDNGAPMCITQDVTVQLDANGNASVTAEQVDDGSVDACGGGNVSLSVTPSTFDCEDIGENTVTLTVTADNGMTSTCTAIVTVEDNIDPLCITQNFTINVGDTLLASDVDNGSSDVCGDVTISVSPTVFDCDDVEDVQIVTLTVTDESGNVSTCTAEVTVVDNGAPICSAQDITVQLDANGEVTITADQVDNGSMNACGGGDVTLSVTPSTFDCENIGENTVTLTVTADNGMTSTCTAVVTVEDNINPLCVTQNFTINVGDTLLASDIDNGSSDVCGDVTLSVSPTVFDCDDVEDVQIVTLTVTDESGNVSTCTAEVTVVDNGAPICSAQDITVQLDATGLITITADQVDNGSMNACDGGDVTLSVSPSTFECENIGENTVTLTVTGDNGMTSTCTAIVTVEDNINPLCLTQNFTINVGDTLLVSDIDDGSSDVCGDVTLAVTPSVFDCDDVADVQVVTLTVTDESGNVSTCTAEVTVVDNGAPICNSQDITVQLDANGEVTITADQVDDGSMNACNGGDVDITVAPSVFDCSNIGDNIVTLTVTADNGQTTTCTSIVTVQDVLEPICLTQDTIIYLDVNGSFTIDSSFVNDGSTDNCGISTITVTPAAFECANVGLNTVTMTVTDVNGNISSCDATVEVADTIGAICATQNITIPLDVNGEATITADQIDNGSTAGSCGGDIELSVNPSVFDCSNVGDNIVTLSVTINGSTSTCTAIVTITEDIAPLIACPVSDTLSCDEYTDDYASFGLATATDNCDTDVSISESVVEDLNNCGVGLVTRTFIATDDSGNTDTCTQVLTFESSADPLQLSDITFPASPLTVLNCGSTDTSATGSVVVSILNDDCTAISINFSDDVEGDGNACDDVITRTWTVIDTCQLDGSGAGIFTFDQIINALDEEAPILVGPADTVLLLNVPNCDGFLDLSDVTATDCHNVTLTNNSPYADDNNSGDASGNYEEGITTFQITATDECGNVSVDDVTVEVVNAENEFSCKKIFFVMDDDLEVVINAFQFVDVVFGCGFSNGDVSFSFSDTDEGQFLDTLTCDQVDFNIDIVVYAYLNNVLYDSCQTIAHLEDSNNFCPDNLTPGITGIVYTPDYQNVSGVNVGLEMDADYDYMTDGSGEYEFMDVSADGTYNIVPFKDDDHMNGVSTLDLILIQRHILGFKKFETPYQMIAADINNNGKINAGDLIELRKVILGKSESFRNNTSWRFIDSKHEEWDMSTVLDQPLPEEYYINSLNNMMYINWLGVKTGDVDNSAIANEFSDNANAENRFDETSILVANDRYVKAGEDYTIDFISDKDQSVMGFQFTMNFDPSMTTYNGVADAELDFSQQNVGDNLSERGKLLISWNNTDKTTLNTNDNIISLKFTAEKDMRLSDCFSIGSDVLKAEWYGDNINDLQLLFNKEEKSELQVLSNVPNPWSDRTDVKFFLPANMDVEFNVYDMSGRMLYSKKEYYNTGLNMISLERSDISAGGVLYYELKTAKSKVIKKMILLRK